MRLGTQTGSVVNHLLAGADPTPPEVGAGATICHWTDRTACTVIAIDRGVVVVREDHAKRTDSNGMSEVQAYEFSPNPDGRVWHFKRNKRGAWRQCSLVVDRNGRERYVFSGSTFLALFKRWHYHDFSF